MKQGVALLEYVPIEIWIIIFDYLRLGLFRYYKKSVMIEDDVKFYIDRHLLKMIFISKKWKEFICNYISEFNYKYNDKELNILKDFKNLRSLIIRFQLHEDREV